MKQKEVIMRLAALGISTTMLCSAPTTLFATEYKMEVAENHNLTSTNAVADENGFVIEDGVLLEYCGDSETVVIPDGVTAIGSFAFENYDSLTEIIIPNSVAEIRQYAFSGCSGLTEIVIPNNVTTLGYGAFKYCNDLTKVVLPDSLQYISSDVFYGTKWLENKRAENPLVIENSILIDATTATGNVVIPDGVRIIGGGAFEECSNLTEMVIPDSVISICDTAFADCDNLVSITMSNGVTYIGSRAFYSCAGLTEIVLPESVDEIGYGAFHGCVNLTKLVLPKNMTFIDREAFLNCKSLSEIVLPNGITTIEPETFYWCPSLTKVVIPNSVTTIGEYAFIACTNLPEIVIPDSVIEIKDGAFEECVNLTKIVIPESVTTIGEDVFLACDNLTIYGYANSYAQTYAKENKIPFIELEKEDDELPQQNPFTDVSKSMYYYKPILWAYENGITAGISATEFAPEQICTRGQVVTFLWRAMGCPEPTSKINPFIDVPEYEYYYKAVLWALENGITAGIDATHFAPDATVTRGQFVTFLHRAENKPSYSVSNPFADVSNSIYYYDAVLWAYENGVTAGTDNTHFAPEDACTRGQVVTFLYRALNQ